MGGCLIDDITDFNRLANLFTIYQSTGKRLQTANLGFGTVEDMFKADDTNGVSPQLFRSEVHKTKPIPAGGTKRIVMKLDLCSFLNQHHWLPCWSLSGGIDIRLTLAEPASVTLLNDKDGDATLSQNYQLQNIAFSIDMKTIDSTLQEMYYKQLAEAGSLLICCKQYSHNAVYLTPSDAGDFAVQITKPVSRLATTIFNMAPELGPDQIKNGQQYCNTFLGYAANEENFKAQIP